MPPKPDFRCRREDGTCWRMGYKGHLCIHALVAAVDALSRVPVHTRKLICKAACDACHDNWQRSTYMQAEGIGARFERPAAIAPSRTNDAKEVASSGTNDTGEDVVQHGLTARWVRAKTAAPKAAVLAVIKILEMRNIYRNNFSTEMVLPSLQVVVVSGGRVGLGLRLGLGLGLT